MSKNRKQKSYSLGNGKKFSSSFLTRTTYDGEEGEEDDKEPKRKVRNDTNFNGIGIDKKKIIIEEESTSKSSESTSNNTFRTVTDGNKKGLKGKGIDHNVIDSSYYPTRKSDSSECAHSLGNTSIIDKVNNVFDRVEKSRQRRLVKSCSYDNNNLPEDLKNVTDSSPEKSKIPNEMGPKITAVMDDLINDIHNLDEQLMTIEEMKEKGSYNYSSSIAYHDALGEFDFHCDFDYDFDFDIDLHFDSLIKDNPVSGLNSLSLISIEISDWSGRQSTNSDNQMQEVFAFPEESTNS
eukprot:Pgem_evm1s13433